MVVRRIERLSVRHDHEQNEGEKSEFVHEEWLEGIGGEEVDPGPVDGSGDGSGEEAEM